MRFKQYRRYKFYFVTQYFNIVAKYYVELVALFGIFI